MKSLVVICTFLYIYQNTVAQDSISLNLNSLLTSNFYQEYKQPVKRKILQIENKSIVSKLNPFTYLSAGLLFVYQRTLSEQLQAECTYQTSCSSYTKFQIEKNGFRGFLLGFSQLNNCTPWAIEDYPSCKITSDNKIINTITKIGE